MREIRVSVVDYGRKYLMMRYVDPITGKQKARSTKTTGRRDAERVAAKWEAELREGRYKPPARMTWADFRERYEDEKLPSLAERTAEPVRAVFNHVEAILNPARLGDLTAETLSYFQAQLRKLGLKESTVGAHLAHLRSALGWAKSVGLLAEVPKIQQPHRAKGKQRHMRGRPITEEEFDRMLAATPKVCPRDAGSWQRYMHGLWLSGLRLEESLKLSWDGDAEISIDLSGKHPRLRIYAEAEKGHKDRLLPMTPDFAAWLLKTPAAERTGAAFKLLNLAGQPLAAKTVSRTISKIGELAKVVVSKADDKFASAHDFRRAYGTRWSSRVMPATLQLLMRHDAVETTLKYYVDRNADDVAAELWKTHPPQSGNTAGNKGQGLVRSAQSSDSTKDEFKRT